MVVGELWHEDITRAARLVVPVDERCHAARALFAAGHFCRRFAYVDTSFTPSLQIFIDRCSPPKMFHYREMMLVERTRPPLYAYYAARFRRQHDIRFKMSLPRHDYAFIRCAITERRVHRSLSMRKHYY